MSSNKKNKSSKIENISPNELLIQAKQILEAGRFRDAIERFKALIKIEDNLEYQIGLAAAYTGRAKELCAKGMIKEAITIWENRHQFCPQALLDLENITVLLRHGHTVKALQLFNKYKAKLNAQQLNEFQTLVAAIYLSGANDIATQLPPNDPIIIHSISIKTALAAYCNGDDVTVNNTLSSIPFRSPYRDLVQIIKSLLKFNEDTNATAMLLKKVPTDSPFYPLLQAIELAISPESEFYKTIENVKPNIFEFAATLRGWSTIRIKLWQEIKLLGDKLTAVTLEKFMHKYQNLLGKEWVRQKCLRLLANGFPKSIMRSPIFTKDKLTPFESSLVSAWNTESQRSVFNVLRAWNQVIDNLRSDNLKLDDKNLRIAIIQRRVENELDLLNQEDDFFLSFDAEPSNLAEQGLAMLEESIVLAPEDLPTYIRLITYYRTRKSLKDARRLLNMALEKWPDEPQLLMEAMDIAKSSGSFKKATTFAKRLLEQDPINSRVKDSLLESHLSHFRKQIANSSFALAQKELAIVETCVRDERSRLKLDVASKFLLLKQQWENGIKALKEFLQLSNTDINSSKNLSKQFAIILEAMYMYTEVDVMKLIKLLDLSKIQQTNVQDFLLFLRLLRELLDQKNTIPNSFILEQFTPAIKHARDLQLSQEDCEILCTTLQRCGLKGLYRLHAGAALERWPGLPIFELHYFESKYSGVNKIADKKEIQRLEQAEKRALETGDTRIANRIKRILDEIGLEFDDYDEDEDEDEETLLEDDESLNDDKEIDIGKMKNVLKKIGIDGIIAYLKQDPNAAKQMEEMERVIGPQKVREMVELALSENAPNNMDWLKVLLDDQILPSPSRKKQQKQPRKTLRPRRNPFRWTFDD